MSEVPEFSKNPAPAAETKSASLADDSTRPVGGVALADAVAFVGDEETSVAVAAAFDEQHIAGDVRTGGVAAAVKYLGGAQSPRLLIVDLSGVEDAMHEIDSLAEVCDPGTSVIAFGTANDVTLFRDLLAAGVADYLIKPVAADAINQSIVNALHHHQPAETGPESHSQGRMIAFVGARGGVGASSVAINCANIVAREHGKRVVFVDLDLQFGTTALALDIEAGRGLREALENPARIDSLFVASAAVNVGQNLFVLAAEEPLDGPLNFDPEALDLLLSELRNSFDWIILDVPRSAAVAQWGMLASASAIVFVSDLTLPGMRDTMRLTGIAKSVVPDAKIVVVANRAGLDKKSEIPAKEFEKSGETKVDYILPNDVKACGLAANNGKSLLDVAKGAKVTIALRRMTEGLVGSKKGAKRPPGWRRLFEK